MRQRLIRTVRKTVNQDSGKDVSAWAPGRPPIEAESAGQQTAGCHPRRQKKAPQWQTRRQGAHVGGGGGGKRGRREPCREPRSNPALVGIGSVLVKSGRACPSAPSHQPVPSAHPMERAGRGGEGENGGGPWRSPCRERPWSVLRGTERPRPYESPVMVSESWLGGATCPALRYGSPSTGKVGIQPSV